MAEIRLLTATDADQSAGLAQEAFGPFPAGYTPAAPTKTPGRHDWGTFESGALVAQLAVRSYRSWWHGVEVATSGIASVAVSPEHRGRGLLGDLLGAALAEARSRGEILSTLYPTAPGIYRSFGYELVTSLDDLEIPTSSLRGMRAVPGVVVRRAEVADVPAVRHVYDTWAAAQLGPLTRRGESFPATDTDYLASVTGVTLALDSAGEVLGYAAWQRGPGYDRDSWVRVLDLLAVDARAYAALWRFFGDFASGTQTVRWRTSGTDAARLGLDVDLGRVALARPYMLRVDDVAALLTAVAAGGEAEFAVAGDRLEVLDGSYRLRDGECVRTSGGSDAPTFTPRGLALSCAGIQSAANLRLMGLLEGPDQLDAVFDAWSGAAPVHVRDYF
ncbi:MAG: GNAT family N-acetyltransferase [Lapillicoccus sp.]